jgi:hypothetical protein
MSQALVTAILEDAKIKQKLYPPPGANVSYQDGGGNKKTEAHWAIAKELFTEHKDHKDRFAEVLKLEKGDPKKAKRLKTVWCNAIKARIRK